MGSQQGLDVCLTGPFSVSDEAGRSLLPRSKKARGILAHLLFQRGKPVLRIRLVDLFWPDRDLEQGRASLRQALYELRNELGPAGSSLLTTRRDSVAINFHMVSCDLWDEDDDYDPGCHQALLDDFDSVSKVFDEWLDSMRRVVRAGQIRKAEDLLARADRGGNPEAVVAAASTVLALDRCNEPAARSLIAAQCRLGRYSTAKAELDKLAQALAEDGFEVSEATRQALRREPEAPLPAAAAIAPRPERTRPRAVPVLALLPGARVDGQATVDALAEELVEEISLRAAGVPELDIVAGPSTLRGQNDARPEDFVLAVSAHRRAEEVVLVARMTDARCGVLCWAMRESLPPEQAHVELGALADQCVSAIVSAIERIEIRSAATRPPETSSAYDHYLRAKFTFFDAPDKDYMTKVQDELEAAIEKDPHFVPAYAHLIQSYNCATFFSRPGAPLKPGRARAMQLAERLLVIDSRHTNSQIAMAWCQMWKGNFDAAERFVEKAMRMGTHEAHRLNSIGTALVYLGRHSDGEAYYELAQQRMLQELDYQRTDFGELYYLEADYERALSWLEFGERRNRFRTLFWRALVLAQLGQHERAARDLDALHDRISKRWVGAPPCTKEDAVRWYLSLVPLRLGRDRKRVMDGLYRLGVRL